MQSTTLDKLAVLLSGVCIFHCLLVPVIVTLVPIISTTIFVNDFIFHEMLLWLIIPTSLIALFVGCRKHRDFLILGTGVVGLLIITTAGLFGHDILTINQEKLLTLLGGLILAVSHTFNFRACQKLTCNDENCATDHHH